MHNSNFNFFSHFTQTDLNQAHKFKFSCSEIKLIQLKIIKSAIQVNVIINIK